MADISKLSIVLSQYSFQYSGYPQLPIVYIETEGHYLSINMDYTVEYSNNINVGKGLVLIKGIGYYSGDHEVEFDITPISIKDMYDNKTCEIVKGDPDSSGCYNTNEVNLSSSLFNLTEGKDYDKLIFKGNGTGFIYSTIEFSGKGNFTGLVSVTVPTEVIVQTNILELTSYLNKFSFNYNGQAFKPTPTVIDNNMKELSLGTDYTCQYFNNINVGYGTVVLNGINNYSGKVTLRFEIRPVQIKNVEISCGDTDKKGNYNLNNLKLTYLNMTLIKDVDYTVETSSYIRGRCTITVLTITGIGNYANVREVSYQTDRPESDISKLKFTYNNNIPFNNEPKTPYVNIYDERFSQHLLENTDYIVEYRNNINVGEGSIYVKAISDDFYGETTLPLIIIPADLANSEVSCGEEDKDGCVDINNLVVVIDRYILRYGFDYAYDVEYEEKDFSLFAILTLRSISESFTGNYTVKYKIEKTYINIEGLVDIDCYSFIYNREIQQPNIISDLIENIDFTVSIPESISVGSYKIVVKGTGVNYIGTVQLVYEIVPRTISDGSIDIGESDENGCYDLDNLVFTVDDVILINTEEYNIYYYTKELEEGFMQAIVTLSGINNYCDIYEFSCLIAKKTIFGKREVTLDRAPIYVRHYGYESCGTRSGVFYLWDGVVVNNRVRICSSEDNCNIVALIVGWVEVSDLDYKRPIIDKGELFEEDDIYVAPAAGDEVRLYRVNLYDMFDSPKPSQIITGRFYISKEAIYNERIRICTFKEDVGKQRKVLGWVSADDV